MRGIVVAIGFTLASFAVGFALARRSADDAAKPITSPERNEVTASQGFSPEEVRQSVAQQLRSLDSSRARVTLLKSLGFPDQAIRNLLGGIYSSLVHEPISAEVFDSTPWWKTLPETFTRDSEKLNRYQLAIREFNETLDSRIDVWALRKAQQRYGIFDAENPRHLNAIFSDYRSLRNQLNDAPEAERETALALLADERTRDIKALLTPEEYARYTLRTSPGVNGSKLMPRA